MWCKTFYFATQIFVVILSVKGRPHEFLQVFGNWFNASTQIPKLLLDLLQLKKNGPGVFRKFAFPLSPQCLHCAAHGVLPADAAP